MKCIPFIRWFALLGLLILTELASGHSISVIQLRTEQLVNPQGIDVRNPRLSWMIQSEKRDVIQKAYRILVASSPEMLAKDQGDLWDSNKVPSDSSQWVSYAGKTLTPSIRCYWKVKCYSSKGESRWSEPAHWSVGLLDSTHWKGFWIGFDHAMPWDNSEALKSRLSARYLRTEFVLKKPVSQATAYIAGLGMYELFINGKRVGDQVLAPAATDYRQSVIYNTFDVTSLLNQKNALAVTLGNGRYFGIRRNKAFTHFGYPKMRLNLLIEYMDGTHETIASDTLWKLTADGPIRSNNEFDGEEFDSRKELVGWTQVGFNDKDWLHAERVVAPAGKLRGAMAPNMKVLQTLKPISIKQVGDKFILDMGQNMVGWIRMNVRGNKGDTIRLRFAETLQKDGSLYVENLRTASSTDCYVCNGLESNQTTWSPSFVYHGFRFVEVSGFQLPSTDDFVGEVVSDEMENLGTFSCSNDVLNQVYKNAWWGILGNYKGFPTDCPQRDERQPWLGDRAMGSWGESYLFENGPLYAKWLKDICEAQRKDGCIPDVAPKYWSIHTDNVTWPSVLVLASDMLYTQFGNTEPMRLHYDNMKRWLMHLKEKYMNERFIITRDKYGDWCVPPESPKLVLSKDPARQTDGKLLSTAYYLKMLQIMQRFCNVLGLEKDKKEWVDLEHSMKEAFNAEFLNVRKDSVFYSNNTVTANILPLAFGLVPEIHRDRVMKEVVQTLQITNAGHISCGMIGVQWLLRELSREGYADVAYLLATQNSYPSWGYMAEQGATTIWELWNGNTADPTMNSGNHVMLLGDLLPWCYEHLAGIRSDGKQVGFKHIVLRPNFEIQDLSRVDASYRTPYGMVVSKWHKISKRLEWEVSVPSNTTAEVHFPDGKVKFIGSGTYHYSIKSSSW